MPSPERFLPKLAAAGTAHIWQGIDIGACAIFLLFTGILVSCGSATTGARAGRRS